MKTKAKIKGVKYSSEYKFPRYKVKLETPEGKVLIIAFDHTLSSKLKGYVPLKVNYDGEDMGNKLSWYSKKVENMTINNFLRIIAGKIDNFYKVS